MLQTTTTGIAARMLILRIIRNARLLIDFCRAVLGIVVHANDFYRILTLYLADSPKASLQVRLLVICNNDDGCKRLLALQVSQPLSRLVDDALRHLTERATIDGHVRVIPV